MKTIQGPAIFLAQFAGDAAPFNSLDSIAKWAASLGYKGVQIPSWDGRLFDLKRPQRAEPIATRCWALWRSTVCSSLNFLRIFKDNWWRCIRV